MGAAINRAAVLNAVSNHGTLAVRAPGGHGVDCTLEAVERHRLVTLRDAEGLVVIIAANVTGCHLILLETVIRIVRQAARRFRVRAAFLADAVLSLAGRFADTCPPSFPPLREGA